MKFVKQTEDFKVSPIMGNMEDIERKSRHGPFLPDSIRSIICGPSNCGKTNLMLSLLLHPRGLRFRNCYVFSKSIQQPKYRFLQNVIDRVPEAKVYFSNDKEQTIPPNKISPNSIIIFDDVACENQDIIRQYFSMGRHHNVDTFYLAQSYTRIPKHLIRDNANFLCIFHQDDLNLQHIYDDHVKPDVSIEDFKRMCQECWKTDKYGYLVIDKDSLLRNGRYRRGLDEFIVV
jgi:Poxvirus A32 protein